METSENIELQPDQEQGKDKTEEVEVEKAHTDAKEEITEGAIETSEDQNVWLTNRLDQLSTRLRDRGDQHITNFSEHVFKLQLKIKMEKDTLKGYLRRIGLF